MVNLTRIYTRTGDAGTTRLGDMSETSKNDLRLHAYADVDEANAQLGVALAHDLEESVRAVLIHAQNDLFDVGADFCTPVKADPGSRLRSTTDDEGRSTTDDEGRSTTDDGALRITQDYVDRLEAWCDEFNADLPSLRSFILSGGTPAAARLHVARTVIRRAERSAWAAYDVHGETMNPLAIRYLNRLSDLVFILARYVNRAEGDVLWVPGGERQPDQQTDQQSDPTSQGDA
jgi:cob(I)alamin adenosyltransferase